MPASDVGSGVGLAGLLGLFAWLLICRNWPAIAAAAGLAGSHQPLSGPYASLMTICFTGVPMVAWSVAVEKVHLRPSTGIDWKGPRLAAETFAVSLTKILGLWATWTIIAAIYAVARWYWQGQYVFAMEVLSFAAVPLFALAPSYVLWLDRRLIDPRDETWHFGRMLSGRQDYDPEMVRRHWRSWAVKGFFTAFMISILPPGFAWIVSHDLPSFAGNPAAIANWLIELLFVIDVQIAIVGYLLTMKPLDAQIRSANPHLAAWVAALICYPPFILMSGGGVLDYHPNTADWAYWLQDRPLALALWGALLVLLTAIYAWATVIYGLRFSNLTYRGIVTNGPYRFTRHPAYLAKNLFWWAATLPFLATSGSPVDAARNTAILAAVSAIYYWRARTEEMHLLAEDGKYRDYHRWMAQHGQVTAGLARLLRPFIRGTGQ